MSKVTQVLAAIEKGDPTAAEELLPLVYDELRKLAAQKLANEKPGQTLEPTALVHEAYLRLVMSESAPTRDGDKPEAHWNGRAHFVRAAAEAMRRILVDSARRKKTEKHGGRRRRIDLTMAQPMTEADPAAVLDLDQALTLLAGEDSDAAAVAKLKIFAGLSIEEAAQTLSVSRA
jgi:RNA polymerase sigma factor (TIGR02999 family)